MIKLIIIFLILYVIFASGKSIVRNSATRSANTTFDNDPFEILGVSPHASDDQVKEAYREQSKKNHPDLVTHMSSDFQKLAEEKLKEINWAYSKIRKERGL